MSCSVRHFLHLELGPKNLGANFEDVGGSKWPQITINANTLMSKN
jgi:hypothetical protein